MGFTIFGVPYWGPCYKGSHYLGYILGVTYFSSNPHIQQQPSCSLLDAAGCGKAAGGTGA